MHNVGIQNLQMRNKSTPKEEAQPEAPSKHQLINEHAGFERDRELELNKSRAIAWRIASLSAIIAAVFGIALVVVNLRFEPVAFLVTVDKATGESSIMKRLNSDMIDFDSTHDKHNLKRYVEAREAYNYTFLQRDYDLTMDMSCEKEAADYGKQFDGERGLDKVLGSGTEWRISVVGVRLLPNQKGQAVVTFDKVVKILSTGQINPPQRFNASIAYEYKPNLKKPEHIWIENPTGFRVCGYRADPEFASK